MSRDVVSLWSELLKPASAGPYNVGFFRRRSNEFQETDRRLLFRRAGDLAGDLIVQGLKPGRPTLVIANKPEHLLLGYLAVVLAGSQPVLMASRPAFDPPEVIRDRLDSHLAALGPQAQLVVDSAMKSTTSAPHFDLDFTRSMSEPGIDLTSLLDSARPESPDAVLHYQFTSGSTGESRAVAITHRGLLANVEDCSRAIDRKPGDTMVSWLPLYHDMALVGSALLSLTSPIHYMLMSPFDFMARPASWLKALAQHSPASSSVPNFALEMCTNLIKDEQIVGLDLRGVRAIVCGAEPISPSTLRDFNRRFARYGLRPDALRPSYGLAEATLIATAPSPGLAGRYIIVERDKLRMGEPVQHRPGGLATDYDEANIAVKEIAITALGRQVSSIAIDIHDAEGKPLLSGFCGEVAINGTATSSGYFGDSPRPAGSWFRTGDVGFLLNDELFIVERIRNMIIRNGENYPCAPLEQQVATQLKIGTSDCALLTLDVLDKDAPVTLVVETQRGIDSETIIERLLGLDEIGIPLDRMMVVAAGSIPRTTSGKKQYDKLRAQLNAGAITEVWSMSLDSNSLDDPVLDVDRLDRDSKILNLIEKHAAARGVRRKPDMDDRLQGDLRLDSLALFEFLIDLETTEQTIPESQIAGLRTVADLLTAVVPISADQPPMGSVVETIMKSVPQTFREIDDQDGRRLLIEGRWIHDFGSLNYLGLDQHPAVKDAIPAALDRWGVHPGWTRAVASARPYFELERQLAALIGSPDTMLFPTISSLHIAVLPLLAQAGDTIIIDHRAHKSIREATELAQHRGAQVLEFQHEDPATLVDALRIAKGKIVVALNGALSMQGYVADMQTIVTLARAYGAQVYIDDAHGIGILGENPTAEMPWGLGGGGLVRNLGLTYDNVIYVAGLSKAFSSFGGFISVRDTTERNLFSASSTAVYSGPVPTASLAASLAALEVNRIDGDQRRSHLHLITQSLIDQARAVGYEINNPLALPIVNAPIGDLTRTISACQVMWEHGILFSPAIFPAVALDSGGLRLSLTCDHTFEDIDLVVAALTDVKARMAATWATANQSL